MIEKDPFIKVVVLRYSKNQRHKKQSNQRNFVKRFTFKEKGVRHDKTNSKNPSVSYR